MPSHDPKIFYQKCVILTTSRSRLIPYYCGANLGVFKGYFGQTVGYFCFKSRENQQAKAQIKAEWASIDLKDYARHHIHDYQDNLALVIAHEGKNNFTG